MLTNYLLAAARGRMVDGAEAELQAASGISGHGIPLELWDVPTEQRGAEGERETRAITPAPGTVGVNLDPIRRPCSQTRLRLALASKCRASGAVTVTGWCQLRVASSFLL